MWLKLIDEVIEDTRYSDLVRILSRMHSLSSCKPHNRVPLTLLSSKGGCTGLGLPNTGYATAQLPLLLGQLLLIQASRNTSHSVRTPQGATEPWDQRRPGLCPFQHGGHTPR